MRKKILVISESLGEPNHKRGIVHFTRDLVRSLADEGHELTLLVETPPRYRKLQRRQRRAQLFPADSRIIELLALYRFLDQADISERAVPGALRRTIDRVRRRLAACTSSGISLLRAIGLLHTHVRVIENKSQRLDYIPADLRHLALFRSFQLESGFYSHQDVSVLALLPPPQVDARDYDIILIDTPTRVAIKRGPDARIVCLVHDLLPLTDLRLSDVATRLFLSRLSTSLYQANELAFVSNHSLNRFREMLPQFSYLPARVVYPRTRFDAQRRPSIRAADVRSGRPTFVVIVSAEPRENLCALIRAFRTMPEADLVVIGDAGGARSVRMLPPNVRYIGDVDEQEKANLIDDAHGLIVPSLAEGSGVPIIEALAANTPVLCSNIPVFREVAGELADYFDPFSTESICASVHRVLASQDEYRRRIRERRGELAERFGHQTQARDFLHPWLSAEYMVAAQ